jgi:tetratricopeptide (TPR) repeat protein
MPVSSPITRQTVGRTFLIAAALLGAAGLAQVAAFGWALATRQRPPGVGILAPMKNGENAAADPAVDALAAGAPLAEPVSGVSEPEPAVVATPKPEPLAPKPEPIPAVAIGTKPVANSRYDELLEQGKLLRDRSDMSNALVKLREAHALNPAAPAAIAALAITYEKMGLNEKAAEYWKRILDMGETAGGSYYIAADARLKQSQMAALMAAKTNASPAPGQPATPALLSLGEILPQEQHDPASGQKLTLRIPIRARAGSSVNGNDLVVYAHIYEQIDGGTLKLTDSNVSYRWATEPYGNWTKGDTETLLVHYSRPRSDPRERTRENRKYFGYIVRVYYKSELQDFRASPARLAAQFPAPQILDKVPAP